jgi:hypothetical protein
MYLSANLKPDDEKENRHQPFVDQEMNITIEAEVSKPDAYRDVPEVRVQGAPGRIGPQQSHNGCNHEDDAARGFDCQESLDRSQDALNTASPRRFDWGCVWIGR